MPVPLPFQSLTLNGVLVINDCFTHFKDHVIVLDDGASGEPTMVEDMEHDCELCASDGFGLISYDLAQQWSEDLKLPATASGFCVRNAFCKGMLFPFPFREFAKKVAKKNMIKDSWGNYKDINRVQVILTTSMLKLWDSYHSCEDYFENCRENHYHFSVTKTCELELDEERNLNYQFIQSYQLTNDEIRELVKPTLDEIKGVMGGDWRDALLYLRGSGMRDDPNYINSLENDYIKALMIEPEMIDDPYVQNRIRYFIKKRISQAKTGVVKVRGNFQVASGDPYALCQSIFGMEITGLLKAGEIYSRFWNDRDVKRVACFRAPMSCHNNIVLRNLNSNDDCKNWYRYMKTVTILSAWDNTCAALNGADFDGDLIFSTDNDVLIKNKRETPTLLCVQKKGEKKIPTEDDLAESNAAGFGNDVGSTTNHITSMGDVQSQFEPGSREYEELDYRIMCGQLYQQNVLDAVKGVKCKPMPRYWYDLKACTVKDDDNPDTIEDKKLWSSICAWRKPYFMSYIYPAQMRDYKQYVAAARKRIKWDGFAGLDEIMQKTVKDDVDEMVIQYYLYRMPVGINSCTMNRLCWTVEDELEDFEEELKIRRKFDYDSLKSGVEYTNSQYYGIRSIFKDYLRFARGNAIHSGNGNNNKETGADRKERIALYQESMFRNLHDKCSNDDALCDIMLDLCKKNASSIAIVWELFHDTLIKRLLERHNGMVHSLVQDENGDIEYDGKRFKDVLVDMNSKEDADDCIE